MSQQSKFFAMPMARCATNTHTFGTRKVQLWLNHDFADYGKVASHVKDNGHESDDDDEIEWDDAGRSLASSIRTSSKQHPAKPTRSGIIPYPPRPQKRRFTPTVINSATPQHVLDAARMNFDSIRDAALEGGSAFSKPTRNDHLDDSGISTSSIRTSFQNIAKLLNEVGRNVNDLESNNPPPVFDLPARPFNAESIDMQLAFSDLARFVTAVHEENRLFLREEDFDEFVESQQRLSQLDLSVVVEHNLDLFIDPELPKHEQALQKSMNLILMNARIPTPEPYQRDCFEMHRDVALTRIRRVFAKAVEDIPDKRSRRQLTFQTKSTNWNNLIYKNGILMIADTNTKFSRLQGRKHLVAYCLRKVYAMLTTNTPYTKRSIYYQLKSTISGEYTQVQVDAALNIVAAMLEMPLWRLNVFCTGRGLVYGPLTLTIDAVDITCNAQNGTSIPTNFNHLRRVKSTAHFVLLVEKDSVFQKILADDVPNRFVRPFILVTGKGFGDTPTKRLLNILWRVLNIPIFILVDADAYGIEIFLNYKFGSKATAFLSQHLALPTLIWFGVYPSEINRFQCKTIALAKKDQSLLRGMLGRPYFQHGQNAAIRKEIEKLIADKRKAEIEGLFKTSRFFTHKYLIDKFHESKFI